MKLKNEYLYHFIYLIENAINHKKYIGKHSTNKLNDGYMGGGIYLGFAKKKYGLENFSKKIIEYCSEETLNDREMFWINELSTFKPHGYNLTNGGDGGNTYSLLSEGKKKIFRKKCSIANLGKIVSEETKKKLRNPKSDKIKEKFKLAWIERKKTPVSYETREKIGNARRGQKHQESSRNKIGQSNSNRIWKEESKNKIRNSKLNSTLSEETKMKIGRKHKCKYCDVWMNPGNLARYHNENCIFR
jgi:hypothetical protein